MFKLRKWYMDCTTPEGAAVVASWARVRWAGVGWTYAAVMEVPAGGGGVLNAWTLRGGAEPAREGASVSWSNAALDVKASWEGKCPSFAATLLDDVSGAVRWDCVLPWAKCAVQVAPWQLPLRELRWGRWLADGDALVWLQWRGARPLTLVVERGREVRGATVGDAVVGADGERLELGAGRVLREGELGVTVLNGIPGLRRVLPSAFGRTSECKWLSRGQRGMSSGWAIHERVVFGG